MQHYTLLLKSQYKHTILYMWVTGLPNKSHTIIGASCHNVLNAINV